MINYNFEGFVLTEANSEQMLFQKGMREILLTGIRSDLNWIPMSEYNFKLTKDDEGSFVVDSFCKTKYDILSIRLKRHANCQELSKNIEINMNVGSYKDEDMINFKRGTTFKVDYEVVNS